MDLTRGFSPAGAARVAVSLWPVNDLCGALDEDGRVGEGCIGLGAVAGGLAGPCASRGRAASLSPQGRSCGRVLWLGEDNRKMERFERHPGVGSQSKRAT